MRIRTIKPEFWTHPVMTRLEAGARLLAIALLNYADDHGFFYADADMVRGAVMFREDSTNVRRWLDDLSRTGFIEVREHPTHGPVGMVSEFAKHQRVDRPKDSDIAGLWDSTNVRRLIDDDSPLEQGMEGNREQGTGNEGTRATVAEVIPIDPPKQKSTIPPEIKPVLDGLTAELMDANRKKSRSYKPNTAMLITWPGEFHDLMESRGLSCQELVSMLRWSQADDFWHATIQSPADLAKHLDKIAAQMKRKQRNSEVSMETELSNAADFGRRVAELAGVAHG